MRASVMMCGDAAVGDIGGVFIHGHLYKRIEWVCPTIELMEFPELTAGGGPDAFESQNGTGQFS